MNKEYVLGFLFDPNKEYVILIQKKRPEWQKGLFNGVGGRIEAGDTTAHQAMQREFKEETGLDIPADRWDDFCTMEDRGNTIHCFYATSHIISEAKTMEDEEVHKVEVDYLFRCLEDYPIISNLSWLIRMAQDPNRFYATVEYMNYPETEQQAIQHSNSKQQSL